MIYLNMDCNSMWTIGLFIGVTAMVFNATFNNISVILWRPVLSVEKTGVPVEKPPTCLQRWCTLSQWKGGTYQHYINKWLNNTAELNM